MFTNLNFALHRETRAPWQPKMPYLRKVLRLSLLQNYLEVSIDIIFTSSERSAQFNLTYRNKNYPTNVIALEYKTTRELGFLTGTLILCDPLVVQEATLQKKTTQAHYSHLLVHGMLHLQGLDHQLPEEAEAMETQEIFILTQLGFQNPYRT